MKTGAVLTFRRGVAPTALIALGLLLLLAGGCGSKEESSQAVVSGRALVPLADAHIFAYREGSDIKGPPFTQSQPSGPDGAFSLALPPGRFMLVLRKRVSGETTGPIRPGDYRSRIIGPVTVRSGDAVDLDFIAALKTGETKDLPSFGAEPSKTGITGTITDSAGGAVQGARVHAYIYPQMSERPKYVSEETGADGSYALFFPEGGTYYLAARTRFGGPPKIGEHYGRYDDGTVEPSAVHIKEGELLEDVDITVHKIW